MKVGIKAGRLGFTLIELLVVMSIISLLMAITLPAFNMVRFKNSEHREYGKDNLLLMYERVPHKHSSFLDKTLKNPLMDAITDTTSVYAQKTGKEILMSLLRMILRN